MRNWTSKILIGVFILMSCSPYYGRISRPYKEDVLGTGMRVSVTIMDGEFHPMCMQPDASDEITCYFYYGWLDNGNSIIGHDGYRFLGLDLARDVCDIATWSLGVLNTREVRDACARALVMHRWVDDAEIYEGEESG